MRSEAQSVEPVETFESDNRELPWMHLVDLTQIPEQAVLFNYRKDGKWITEKCEPSFIRKQLLSNAEARWKTLHNPNSFWKGDKKGKGLELVLCPCGSHFLGTKRADYSCGGCETRVNHVRGQVNTSLFDCIPNGTKRMKPGLNGGE
jgi:hypothetical protein